MLGKRPAPIRNPYDAQAAHIRQLEAAQAAQAHELKAAVLALQSSQHNN